VTTPADLPDADELIESEQSNVIDLVADNEVEEVPVLDPVVKYELLLETKFKPTIAGLLEDVPDFPGDNDPDGTASTTRPSS